MPSNVEIAAAKTATHLKAFIAKISTIEPATLLNHDTATQLKNEFIEIETPANLLFQAIIKEARQQNSPTIENYYYLYLLQQAARFNQFYNCIESIIDERGSLSCQTTAPPIGAQLKKSQIYPFNHALLHKAQPTKMTVVIKKRANTFREHIRDTDYRKYYNPKSSSLAENDKHQDHDHYYKANVAIGSATQRSNLFSLFSSGGQSYNEYFKPADQALHKRDKDLYAAAIHNIQHGTELTDEQREVLKNSPYYRFPQPVKFLVPAARVEGQTNQAVKPLHNVTHLGHASELIAFNNTVDLMIAIDPVNYQSGTDGILIKNLAKIGYPRHTTAALATHDYPATQVVVLSHNHHDHMCFQSLTEAFSANNTLFVVPLGDGRRMRENGLLNVIEFNSWNDYAEITLTSFTGESTYEVSSFPAKHASNRFTNDLYMSLYMGFMLRDLSTNNLVLCTGDTAVLDNQHFIELEKHLVTNQLRIQTACIASGPDRPRKWMECTHQSTADAVTMHARINVMNAKAKIGQQSLDTLSEKDISAQAAHAIGYHQGCFRLGLLTLQDVHTTLTRLLAALKTLPNDLQALTQTDCDNNIFYQFMDNFEQQALWDIIQTYQQFKQLDTSAVIRIIADNFFVPQPGNSSAGNQFHFDYETLIQNRDPAVDRHSYVIAYKPYEYFAKETHPALYQYDGVASVKRDIIKRFLIIYENRTFLSSKYADKLSQFSSKLATLPEADIMPELGRLYASIFPKQDEGIRDEGHTHTIITILAGLIYFPEFRDKFAKRHQDLTATAVRMQRP